METLNALKEYLADRPEIAFLALTLVALAFMFRKYDRARGEHIKVVSQLAPLADKLCRVIEQIQAFKRRWPEG